MCKIVERFSQPTNRLKCLIMLCEETRQSLSLYIDDCVSLPARVAIDEHLIVVLFVVLKLRVALIDSSLSDCRDRYHPPIWQQQFLTD